MLTINNTIDGAIQDIEIKGNTVQDPDNLADIKSVGELQEDGTYKMSILSCGKNLFDGKFIDGKAINFTTGEYYDNNNMCASANFISVNGNSSYYLNVNPSGWVIEYDANKKCIKGRQVWNNFTTSENCRYVKFYIQTSVKTDTIQLEKGTKSTPYEPYQGNKCDILLPCQLEKVGDVADRIICKDGVWGVEKNVVTTVLDDTKPWGFESPNATMFGAKTPLSPLPIWIETNQVKHLSYPLATKSHNQWNSFELEGTHIHPSDNYVFVNVFANKLETVNIDGFKKWVKNNPVVIKYPTKQPTFIPLPRNTQIALNSFFGTTHVYMESGEVEGTIKCKIPKSLGATVQSLNNKTDILSDRIEAIEGLKDSQNMKYETDKGYLVCKETKNGVIDDLKIEGKTLVAPNIHPLNDTVSRRLFHLTNLKNDTLYTLVNPTEYKIAVYEYDSWTDEISDGYKTGNYTFNSLNNTSATVYFGGDVLPTGVFVVEGDHTQNPPSYFEGLMSVGQDVDKIEVLSVNENLVPSDWDYKFQCFGDMKVNQIDTRTFEIVNTNTVDGIVISKNFINKFCYNNKVVFDFYSNQRGIFYVLDYGVSDESYKPVQGAMVIEDGRNVFVVDVSNASGRLAFRFNNNTKNSTMIISDFSIKTSKNSNNVNHQSDKKQILFYNENGELEPIQELHEWDSIEKHSDNKWYYHKRSGKIVLNGSEEFYMIDVNDKPNTLLFHTDANFIPSANVIKDSICDKLALNKTISGVDVESHLVAETSRIYIRLLKSKLSTQDVQGFKQWLQTNNVTVVYQLAQEEVYELAPLHLDSYANETLILCNSGAISPKMEFSITSHINELVKAYGERINLLEEKVYKYMVTQNRMQLASTYSADSVTFKVDYFSLCGDEENYDEDLYNLILNNILVGKDNYDYDKMFTIILDYASWNQISWEQFDILVGLMDIQHNPPVEELPTEDIIEEDIIENEETPVE